MNVIQLELVPDPSWLNDYTVSIVIDGEPLIELVRKIEAPYLQAIGTNPEISRYKPVRARVMLLPGRHLLGEPIFRWFEGFSEILVCTCGEALCGAIAVSVRVWPERIGWLAWRQFAMRESSPLCEFRPMIFHRSQYEAELIRISEEYQRLKPDS